MSLLDVLLTLLIGGLLAFAAVLTHRSRKSRGCTGCSGDCASCGAHAGGRRGERMNVSDILLIAALAVGCASAIYYSVRRARKGSECCGDIAGKVRRTGPADHKRSHYGFRAEAEITGMTCDNCAARVENALNSLEGIWASVRIDTGKARILSKETVDERKIREAVRGAGYGVGKLKT